MTKTFIFKFLISLLFLTLPSFANNYVSLTPVLTEIIYALEAQDNLLGVSSVCNYPKEAQKKEIIGDTFYANMEKIVSLKPNYLFAMASAKPLLGQLYHTNTKPIYFEFYKFEDIYNAINKIAKIAKKEENAKKLIANIQNNINKYKTKNPKKILYIIQFEPLITIGNKSYINDVIEKSGNINVTSNINFQYPNITLEYAIKSKPDLIVLWENNGFKKAEKIFKNTTIIELNKQQQDIINRPGPRIDKAVEIFSKL